MAYRRSEQRVVPGAQKRARLSRALHGIAPTNVARRARGSFMPFLCVSVVVFIGTLGICLDLMRDFEAAHQLEFAAQTAALYGLSLATNPDGSYSSQQAQANIENAIATAGGAGWNQAQVGPIGKQWQSPVTFDQSDLLFLNNPNPQDATEFFVQLSARRDGVDSLHQFFLPALSTSFPPSNSPQGGGTVTSRETVEVVGQPASRVGPGAPSGGSNNGTRAGQLAGFAALPLAISNSQFASMSNPNNAPPPNNSFTVDLVGSTSTEYKSQPAANHVKGCFVNDSATAGGAGYYGTAQGNPDIDQLESLLNYFGAGSSSQVVAPAEVERGSALNGYDQSDPTFASRQNQVLTEVGALASPTRFYIVPVIAADPSFSSQNVVAGFARLQLISVSKVAGVPQITVKLGESVVVRNASSAAGFSSIPTNLSRQLPVPVAPFTPRTVDMSTNLVSSRPRGVVLAPAVSPRRLSAT